MSLYIFNNFALKTANAAYPGRAQAQALFYNSLFWVMGGAVSGFVNDVWSSPDCAAWTQVTAGANWAARKNFASAVYNNLMWVFGGSYASGFLNDVWYSSNGSSWTRSTASANWTARTGLTGLMFNNKLWVLGGYDGITGFKNDVWYSSDGITWTQATASAGWTARYYHQAAVFNNKMWIMGGGDAGGFKNDVWSSSDGVNWTLATANAGWHVRDLFSALAFQGMLWVVAGLSDSGGQFNDVWTTSDGSTWTQISAAANFPKQSNTALVTDTIGLYLISGDSSKNVWWEAGYFDLGADVTIGKYPLKVTFNTLLFNLTTLFFRKFYWDFGDNTTSTEENPEHVYQMPGTYKVRLTVTNAFNLTYTIIDDKLIHVYDSDYSV